MAKERQKSFPMLPVAHWWTLREKFKQSMPGIVTDNYLATALNTQAKSARANVLPFLKDLGLIDAEGRTQDLAKAWRDDEQYADVCQTMRKNVYPEELTDAVPNPSADRSAAERWFANVTGAGATAVKRMTAIYVVISEADAANRPEAKPQKENNTSRRRAPRTRTERAQLSIKGADYSEEGSSSRSSELSPGLHINLQIHISPDATPDQIDKIFASISRHIYKK